MSIKTLDLGVGYLQGLQSIRCLVFFSFLCFCVSCNLEKEVEIELPAYESQTVVECYIQAGEPFRLLLTRSASFFDAFPTDTEAYLNDILVNDAEVTITHQGKVYPLENQLTFDPFNSKLFNYRGEGNVPENYEDDFELKITTKDGEQITATTTLLRAVPIDSVVVEFNDIRDTLARALTYFTDDAEKENFYRRTLHFGTIDTLRQDFTINDRFVDNDVIVFGTDYDYLANDTIITSIYHINEEYYDFLESLEAAVDANGNPFGQPSSILSNVKGERNPIGIFTGFSFDRKVVIIE